MLLNLSNHPSSGWTTKQRQAALDEFGGIEDLSFPPISPHASLADVQELCRTYIKEISARKPQAVHIMGEQTFCFHLITRLRRKNIPCIASTTERLVQTLPDGKKLTGFSFVQFRSYF